VQFVQGWYQRARHYPRVALVTANPMDVSHTETLSEFHQGLYPIVGMLFVAHLWQIFNGASMLLVLSNELKRGQSWFDFREEIQCCVIGVMFVFLGFTNMFYTVLTIVEKSQRERERQESASAAAAAAAAATQADADARARAIEAEVDAAIPATPAEGGGGSNNYGGSGSGAGAMDAADAGDAPAKPNGDGNPQSGLRRRGAS
jgi:hypothetical protein